MIAFAHYRVSTVGIELEETLQELLKENVIDYNLVDFIKNEFDKAMVIALRKCVKDKPVIKGKLKHYQNCDNVWVFEINSPEIRVSSYSLPIQINGPLKIVACDSKLLINPLGKKSKFKSTKIGRLKN
nr:transcription initiation factor IIA gamma chain [Cryptomonas sp.]